MSVLLRNLRLLAVLGASLHLLVGLAQSLPLHPGRLWMLLLLPVLALAATVCLLGFGRRGARTLAAHCDLLVPIGLYVLARQVLNLLMLIPVLGTTLGWSNSVQLMGVTLALGPATILYYLLNTLFAGWTVALMVPAVQGSGPDLLQPLRNWSSWFGRVLLTRLLGSLACWIYLTGGLALMMTLFRLGWMGGLLTVLLLLPVGLGLNLAGLFLYPAVMRPGQPFWPSLFQGVTLGLRLFPRLLPPTLAFSVLVGSIPRFTCWLSSSRQSFNVRFDIKWLADFPANTAWEASVARWTGTDPLPFVSHALELLLLGVGVAMMLEMYHRADLPRRLADSTHPDPVPAPPVIVG
jgi:hypothetical protein